MNSPMNSPESDFDSDLTRLPKARTEEIVTQDFEDDVLVYDIKINKAHHLNKTLSIVWQNCDGKTTTKKVAKLLSDELNTKIEEDFVWVALDELQKANLLKDKVEKENFTKLSRRKVLFRYALPAVTLPVIMSLVAPESIHAQSCTAMQLDPCNFGGTPCCVGTLTCQANIGNGPPFCI